MPISCQTCRDNLSFLLQPPPEDAAPALPDGASAASPDTVGAMPSQAELQAHLTECADCARELAMLQNITATLRDLPPQTAPASFRAGVLARLQADSVQAGTSQANNIQADSATVLANEKAVTATPAGAATLHAAPAVLQRPQPVRRPRFRWPDFFRQPARVAWAGSAVFASLVVLLALTARGPQSFQPAPESALNAPFAADTERDASSAPTPRTAGRVAKSAANAPGTKRQNGDKAKYPIRRSATGAMAAAPPTAPSAKAGSAPLFATNPHRAAPPTGVAGDVRAQQSQRNTSSVSTKAIGGATAKDEATAARFATERPGRESPQLRVRRASSSSSTAPSTGAASTAARIPAPQPRGLFAAAAVRPHRFARLEMVEVTGQAVKAGAANALAMGLSPSAGAFSLREGAASAGAAADASRNAKATLGSQSRGGAARDFGGAASSEALTLPRGSVETRTRKEAPNAPAIAPSAPAPSVAAGASPARGAEPSAPPVLSAAPGLAIGSTAPSAQRKTQNTQQDAVRQDEARQNAARAATLGIAAPSAVRRARLLIVPSRDAAQTRIRVVLPPGLRFVDGASMARSDTAANRTGAALAGSGGINSRDATGTTSQPARVVWAGRARRGQAIEIVLFFAAPPGPAAVRVVQESPVSRALPERTHQKARGPVWETINEQTVIVTIH
jgi:hypothetical protein